jgi:hypothetical protein
MAESVVNRLVRTKEIRGEQYSMTLLNTEAGEEPLVRLIELLGPAFVDTISSKQVLGLIADAARADRNIDGDFMVEVAAPLAEAARGVIGRLQRNDLSYFAGVFKPLTKVGRGKSAQELETVYDVHFAGKYGALRDWLVWCLMENFADFFGGGGGILNGLAAVKSAVKGEAEAGE